MLVTADGKRLGANGSENVKTLLILRSVAVSVTVITVPSKGQKETEANCDEDEFAEITPVRGACEMTQVGNADGGAAGWDQPRSKVATVE